MNTLACLTRDHSTDQVTISTILSSQDQLTHALVDALSKITAHQTNIKALKESTKHLANTCTCCQGPPTTKIYHNSNYCHTHGYHIHNRQTSATCKYAKPSHKEETTQAITVGSIQEGKVFMWWGWCQETELSLIHTINNIVGHTLLSTPTLTQTLKTSLGIADTGATGHFLPFTSHCINRHANTQGLHVHIPKGNTIQATHTANLDIPELLTITTAAHIFPHITHPLILIGQLCSNGCQAMFTTRDITVMHNTNTILKGTCDTSTGLWTLVHCKQQQQPATATALNVYKTNSKEVLVKYLHQCCFSPSPAAWAKAVQARYFAAWLWLTSELDLKHLPKSEVTIKGHQW